MSGYSRIRQVSTERSKSLDFSDLPFSPKISNPIKTHISTHQDINKENQNKNTDESIDQEEENEDTDGEIFGVILSKKCSLSSKLPSNNFMCEKQSSSSSVHSALKRTLSSIKRSSSVSGGYCKIHHQCDPTATATAAAAADDEDILMLSTLQTRSVKKKGKFLKACKRILGF